MKPDPAQFDESDKMEWFEVCQRIRPEMTEEEYEQMWTEFVSYQESKLFH